MSGGTLAQPFHRVFLGCGSDSFDGLIIRVFQHSRMFQSVSIVAFRRLRPTKSELVLLSWRTVTETARPLPGAKFGMSDSAVMTQVARHFRILDGKEFLSNRVHNARLKMWTIERS